MLLSSLSSLHRPADASRPVAKMAVWDAMTIASPASYFYGYWFSHWRA
ncbi:hypothetical protein ABDX87_27245 [Pseudomonas abietaniphila]|jgi:hypothetical protein